MKKITLLVLFLFLFSKPVLAATLFSDGFNTNFSNWTESRNTNGTGVVENGTGKFTVPNAASGGYAYVAKSTTWPATKKLWYSCDVKVSDKANTNAVVGGIYLLEASVLTGGWRDRGNLEITDQNAAAYLESGQTLTDNTFILRMAFRGRNNSRDNHRQVTMVQAPTRNVWHHVQMLVDLSGSNPRYAWWLNNRFIWEDEDESTGIDTAAPEEFRAGLTGVDWGSGNKGLVWVDNCSVSDTGPEPGQNVTAQKGIAGFRDLLNKFNNIFDYNSLVANYGSNQPIVVGDSRAVTSAPNSLLFANTVNQYRSERGLSILKIQMPGPNQNYANTALESAIWANTNLRYPNGNCYTNVGLRRSCHNPAINGYSAASYWLNSYPEIILNPNICGIAVGTYGDSYSAVNIVAVEPISDQNYCNNSIAPSETIPPSVQITTPVEGAVVYGGTSGVTISATANDAQSAVDVVTFYIDGTHQLGQPVVNSPYNTVWSASVEGSYTLTAVAKDVWGNTAISAPVHVTVSNITPTPVGYCTNDSACQFLNSNPTLMTSAKCINNKCVSCPQEIMCLPGYHGCPADAYGCTLTCCPD